MQGSILDPGSLVPQGTTSNGPLKIQVEENQGPPAKKMRILSRKFTVNGAISDVKEYFFVEPDNTWLVNKIESKAYIMLTGHRGSGKTTRCWYAIHHQLANFEVLMTTFQSISSATSENFWIRYGKHIKRQCTFWAPDQIDITDADSFLEFFKYHAGKRIVLFVDEFDLLSSRTDILNEFLDVLRSIKDERPTKYGLQALVAVGPYNISRYTKGELSPFNATNHWDIPYWTKDQVEALFREFEESYGVVLEAGVIDSLFIATRGHPGMVCFCGKMIQDKLLLNSASLSLKEWKEYEVLELRHDICVGWRTVGGLADAVKEPRFHNFLIRYMLSTATAWNYNEEDTIQLELIGIGAVALRQGKIEISSPLVRSVVLNSVTYERRRPVDFLPVSEYGVLDVSLFMRNIHHFDGKHMCEAPQISNKHNETSHADVKVGDMVPHEDTYTFELSQLLISSLPSTWRVTGEMNGPDRTKVDFVISNDEGERVVMEVVAHERDDPVSQPSSLLGHIARCASAYSQITGVVQSWVINFTTRKPDKSCEELGYVWSLDNRVSVVHVWHDLAWTAAKIIERDDTSTPKYTTTDLVL